MVHIVYHKNQGTTSEYSDWTGLAIVSDLYVAGHGMVGDMGLDVVYVDIVHGCIFVDLKPVVAEIKA
jgi:hypothetical protein